jgi:Secretion system C-terminal sorting domain
MKKNILFSVIFIAAEMCFSGNIIGQTAGTFTFSFTPVAKTPTYNGNSEHTLAVWIQANAGGFVKTKLRYCCGSSTIDHLPTWAVNASCGVFPGTTIQVASDAACNIADAVTGATLTTWAAKTITWDGKTGSAATGTVVPDGVYKVTIEEVWNHGPAGAVAKSYTFTKGPNTDHQTPANDVNFTNIKLDWVPLSTMGIEGISANEEINIYPNPSQGILNIDFKKGSSIKIMNTLGIVIYDAKKDKEGAGVARVDLSNFASGVYVVTILNEDGSSGFKKMMLSK